MKSWIALAAALPIAAQAFAQSNPNSVMAFGPSCAAAADIAQGKHPAADSVEASKQLRKSALCFGAVTAVLSLEPVFKPAFAMCPPADKPVTVNQALLAVIAFIRMHPEQMQNNFHQVAAAALAAAWPCPKPDGK
jgi:hypothetical protein